jgi:HAD superfamily hydrolase (TIGR01509 family)
MYRFILWDHDGVLVDTEQWYFAATQKALSELGIILGKETYLSLMAKGQSCWDLAMEQRISPQEIEMQRRYRNTYYQRFLQTEHIEVEGVIPVLKQLSQQYRMAIVTTARREDFEFIHRNCNIKQYMEFVITVEDHENSKPHPEPYLAGLSRFDAKPDEAIAIEDSSRGLQSAVAANLECIVIQNEFTASQDFSLAKRVIGSIRELPAILSS